MNCLNCNKETNNPKFCSRSCSAQLTNRLYPKRRTKNKCIVCGDNVISYRYNKCQLHHNEYKLSKYESIKDVPLKIYWNKDSLKDLHLSSKNVHIRQYARSRFKNLVSLPCANCGYNKHVELCHIKPISSFNEDSTMGEVNSKENLIQLCRNCHWEFDHNLLDLSPLLDSNQ